MTTRKLCRTCAGSILRRLPRANWTSDPAAPGSKQRAVERPADCPSEITISDPVAIKDLAAALHIQPFEVIGVLMGCKIFTSMNEALDFASASLVCAHYGVTPKKSIP